MEKEREGKREDLSRTKSDAICVVTLTKINGRHAHVLENPLEKIPHKDPFELKLFSRDGKKNREKYNKTKQNTTPEAVRLTHIHSDILSKRMNEKKRERDRMNCSEWK